MQIQDWIGATNKEIRPFIEELLEERLINVKYDFQCDCGNNCTVYQRRLELQPYQCEFCEKEYTLDEVIEKATLLYELDKQAIMEFDEENVDFKGMMKPVNKVVKMPEKQEEKTEVSKKKIFIGSSSKKEVLAKMEMVARIIDDLGGEAIPWNSKNEVVFIPGQYTFDSLISIANNVDGAIFMFNAEDLTWFSNTGQLNNSVRDNVLLEYGLFAGIRGKEKVTFICEDNPKIASDLLGITYIDGKQSEYQMKPFLQKWLAQV